ncbi:hypothetical protein ACHQM5_008760 [Ranunculus cassubicifolius]
MSFRNSVGDFLLIVAEGIGIADNFWAEMVAIITGVEIALSKGWGNMWVESDSKSAVAAIHQDKIPWKLQGRWNQVKHQAIIHVSHIWREANLTADYAAKKELPWV